MTAYKILVGDTDTPQARIPKSGDQSYLAPVTVDDSSGVETCFEIEATIQQSGTAGYTALQVTVIETSTGSGAKTPINVDVGGSSVFSVDNAGNVTANNVPVEITGVFTPTIQDNSQSDAEGQTYTWQRGFFIKIGKLVIFNIGINLSSAGTLNGSDRVRIAGLPFTNSSAANNHASISVGNASNTLSTAPALTGVIFAGANRIDLYEWNGAGNTNNLTVTEFGGGGELMVSGSYWTD